MSRQSPTFVTGRFPRTMQEAFGPYAQLDTPSRPNWSNRLTYLGICIVAAIVLALVIGCSEAPHHRVASAEIQDELRFQEARAAHESSTAAIAATSNDQ